MFIDETNGDRLTNRNPTLQCEFWLFSNKETKKWQKNIRSVWSDEKTFSSALWGVWFSSSLLLCFNGPPTWELIPPAVYFNALNSFHTHDRSQWKCALIFFLLSGGQKVCILLRHDCRNFGGKNSSPVCIILSNLQKMNIAAPLCLQWPRVARVCYSCSVWKASTDVWVESSPELSVLIDLIR